MLTGQTVYREASPAWSVRYRHLQGKIRRALLYWQPWQQERELCNWPFLVPRGLCPEYPHRPPILSITASLRAPVPGLKLGPQAVTSRLPAAGPVEAWMPFCLVLSHDAADRGASHRV